MLLTNTEREKEQRAECWPAASQCHHTAFVRRVDLERTFQREREKRVGDDRKIQKRAMRDRQSKRRRGGETRGKIITKGNCKGEDGQIMRKEKN